MRSVSAENLRCVVEAIELYLESAMGLNELMAVAEDNLIDLTDLKAEAGEHTQLVEATYWHIRQLFHEAEENRDIHPKERDVLKYLKDCLELRTRFHKEDIMKIYQA